jgi:DICT domain-containing protein
VELPVDRRQPLSREWAVVISADAVQACLAAWEQPSETRLPDAQRRFEVLWSFDPAVVADAVTVTAELITPLAPKVARRLEAARAEGGPSPETALHHGGALAQRMVGYLGQLLTASGGAARHVSP